MVEIHEEFPGENEINISQAFIDSGNGCINVRGKENIINIGRPHHLGRFYLEVNGRNHVRIHSLVVMNEQEFRLMAPGLLEIGEWAAFAARSTINIHESANVKIGSRCLIASDVSFSCSSIHKIIDLTTGQRVNPPGDIVIGDHVWIAANVSVWGGTNIGSDCVVGYGSFVAASYPSNCVLAGTPARVVRENVTWEA